MHDSRYPWLRQVPRGHLEKVASEVCRRMSVKCLYNNMTGLLYFYVREPAIGVASAKAVKPDKSERRFSSNDVDAICYDIFLGRLPTKEKDKILAAIKARNDHDTSEHREAFLENEQVPEWNKRLRHARDRRGMVGQRSAVVDGLKGQQSTGKRPDRAKKASLAPVGKAST